MEKKTPELKKILFQQLGNTWYVFAEASDNKEIICSAIPPGIDPRVDSFELYEIIEEHFENMGQKRPAIAA